MINDFWKKDGSNERKQQMHYQLCGTAASRLRKNVQKMKEGILGHAGNPFGKEFSGLASRLSHSALMNETEVAADTTVKTKE